MIESTDPRDRVTVELKQSGQRMSLRRDKLQVVHEGRSDSEGEGPACTLVAMASTLVATHIRPFFLFLF